MIIAGCVSLMITLFVKLKVSGDTGISTNDEENASETRAGRKTNAKQNINNAAEDDSNSDSEGTNYKKWLAIGILIILYAGFRMYAYHVKKKADEMSMPYAMEYMERIVNEHKRENNENIDILPRLELQRVPKEVLDSIYDNAL